MANNRCIDPPLEPPHSCGKESSRHEGRGSDVPSCPIVFQECPGCECLIRFLDYAEVRLPTRVVHLLHCKFCAVGYMLSVYPEGRSVMIECRRPSAAYRKFLAGMREAHKAKSVKDVEAALAA